MDINIPTTALFSITAVSLVHYNLSHHIVVCKS